MFGLSLTKILFTLGAIVAVWKVFRYLEARAKARLKGDRGQGDTLSPGQRAVEELTECAVCGIFVSAAAAAPCDRPDCPHRR